MQKHILFIALGLVVLVLGTTLLAWSGQAANAQGPVSTLMPGIGTLLPTGLLPTGIPTSVKTLIPKTQAGGTKPPAQSTKVTPSPAPQETATAAPQETATTPPTGAPTQAPTAVIAPTPTKAPSGPCPGAALLPGLLLGGVLLTRSLRRR